MTDTPRRRRSALYLPASNDRAIAKARTLACDVVILDLEDSVAPEAKEAARAQAVTALALGDFGDRELVVRINALDTEWAAADLAALAEAPPHAILLPKVNGPADLAACAALLPGDVALWAMIETPAALLALGQIAAAPRLAALVMGINDLAKDMGMQPGSDRLPFHSFLATTVAAARAHGLGALDGVFNGIDDAQGLVAECAQGRRFGFDGKTLIHPSQIAACNSAFSPGTAEIAEAEAIRDAFALPEHAGKGAIRLDGRMVERLHLAQALRVLATVGR
ncbi:HpcH/HpaI aldolase/citrate lyase family protein [Sphingomonas qomolangmaensis]|uniref:CoA ester lyase n=1 Tax=Sphingomonas qomolangmaensis TaxID=2918765 RepID=A0ABY5L9W2_9SPHN|nr:CoA ester lyase [Sphingomonas qomolangmaensis]UUL82838.1 CoA ester lyase [Sphingomonas qomolangmaensis]